MYRLPLTRCVLDLLYFTKGATGRSVKHSTKALLVTTGGYFNADKGPRDPYCAAGLLYLRGRERQSHFHKGRPIFAYDEKAKVARILATEKAWKQFVRTYPQCIAFEGNSKILAPKRRIWRPYLGVNSLGKVVYASIPYGIASQVLAQVQADKRRYGFKTYMWLDAGTPVSDTSKRPFHFVAKNI
jgi:hypothetical protein